MSARTLRRFARSGIGRRGGCSRGDLPLPDPKEKSGCCPAGGFALPGRKSMTLKLTFADGIGAHIAPQDVGDRYRAVGSLIILHDLAENARHRERGVVERMHVAYGTALVAIADIEPARLKIMEVGR